MANSAGEISDISVPLDQATIIYPGDPDFDWKLLASLAAGDSANVSCLTMSSHTGTHVDVPAHFLAYGLTLDQIPLDYWLGPCLGMDVTKPKTYVTGRDLASQPLAGYERILLKTQNSLSRAKKFQPDFIYLAESACDLLIAAGVKTLGFDYLSVVPPGSSFPAHHKLLASGICLIESLLLEAVQPGPYYLVCLPLRLSGAEAAPARAVLLPENPAWV